MRVRSVTLRDFRCYAETEARFGPGLTVVTGAQRGG